MLVNCILTALLKGSNIMSNFDGELAKRTTDWREHARIVRAAGYTVKFIEGVLRKRQDEEEPE